MIIPVRFQRRQLRAIFRQQNEIIFFFDLFLKKRIMVTKCSECASAAEQIEGLTELLFNPSSYREAFRENMESDNSDDLSKAEIFEVLKKELVEYAKKTPSFKKYLLTNLGESKGRERSMSRARPTTQSYTPRIRSPMIYNPRSSSRPTLD